MAVLVEAKLSVQAQGRKIACASAHGKDYSLAPANCFMHKHLAYTLALMLRVDYQSGDADLIGFVIGTDAQIADKFVFVQSPDAELLAGLDFLHRFVEVSEALRLHQCCLLCIGECQDRMHLTCDLQTVVIYGRDVNHGLCAP